MHTVERARHVLARAEAELRELVSSAAASGEYTSVVHVASWARTIAELVRSPGHGAPSVENAPKAATTSARARAASAPTQKLETRASSARQYPRFFKSVDRLVRVAWSRSSRQEYEHKAPLAVVARVSEALATVGDGGRVFTTDDLMPVLIDGVPVPSYQVYLVLALLKQVGLLEQHGRSGYSIPSPSQLRSASEGVVANLPEE